MIMKVLRMVLISGAIACGFTAYAQALHVPTQRACKFSLLDPPRQLPIPNNTVLGSPWSYQKLGTFCKLDVQLERRLKFPVLFRLGDPRQVDALEGKGPLWSAENRP
jgi:hypothetical protein